MSCRVGHLEMSEWSIQCQCTDNLILPRVKVFLWGGWRKFSCRYWPDQSELRAAAGFVSRQPWRVCWEQRRAEECFPPEYYNVTKTYSSHHDITLSPALTGAPHSRRRSMVGTEGKLQMGYLPTDEVSLLQARWRGLDPPLPLAPTFTNS